jgi:hypothetical protein
LFLILPDTSRLYQIFVLNASTQPSNLREPVLSHNSARRAALVFKFTILEYSLFEPSLHLSVDIARWRLKPHHLHIPSQRGAFIGVRRSLTTGKSCAKNAASRYSMMNEWPTALGLLRN